MAKVNRCLQLLTENYDNEEQILLPSVYGDDRSVASGQKASDWSFQLQMRLAGRLEESQRYSSG